MIAKSIVEASSEHVAGASDFFCRCVETAADTSDSEVLFQELRTKPYLLKGMIAVNILHLVIRDVLTRLQDGQFKEG